MNKKEIEEIDNNIMVADALLRLKTIENLLVAKGIFTEKEFNDEMTALTIQLSKSILEKAGLGGELESLIKSLEAESKKITDN